MYSCSNFFCINLILTGSSTGGKTSQKLQCHGLKHVKLNAVFKFFLSPVMQFFLNSRLGMNPFQKNPKHASVLAER